MSQMETLSSAGDASLADLLKALPDDDGLPLIIDYGKRRIQPGYHITEVKAGNFVTLDCGGNPDAWQETVLQVEDVAPKPGEPCMAVGKFRKILAQVDRKVGLQADARLTFEIGRPGEAMQVFDVAGVVLEEGAALLSLTARPAICKPRHRAAAQIPAAAACCAPASGKSCCA